MKMHGYVTSIWKIRSQSEVGGSEMYKLTENIKKSRPPRREPRRLARGLSPVGGVELEGLNVGSGDCRDRLPDQAIGMTLNVGGVLALAHLASHDRSSLLPFPHPACGEMVSSGMRCVVGSRPCHGDLLC